MDEYELDSKIDAICCAASDEVQVRLAVVLPEDVANSLTVEAAAKRIAEGFLFTLTGAKLGGVVTEVHSVPKSWWQYTKLAVCRWLPDFVARRISVDVVEIPTVVHVKGR